MIINECHNNRRNFELMSPLATQNTSSCFPLLVDSTNTFYEYCVALSISFPVTWYYALSDQRGYPQDTASVAGLAESGADSEWCVKSKTRYLKYRYEKPAVKQTKRRYNGGRGSGSCRTGRPSSRAENYKERNVWRVAVRSHRCELVLSLRNAWSMIVKSLHETWLNPWEPINLY